MYGTFHNRQKKTPASVCLALKTFSRGHFTRKRTSSRGCHPRNARWFPMQLKRRGVELRLIVGDYNRSAAIVDLSLLKAVARAHRWFDEISTGKARPLAATAAREGLSVRYVGRFIPYGQNISHMISRVPENSDKPEKTRFLTF